MEKEKLSLWGVLAFHWRHAMRFPKLVAVSLIVGPVTLILDRYIAPLLIASVLLSIQHGTVSFASSWWLIFGYVLLQIISQVIGYRISMYAMWGVQIFGARNIYNEVYAQLSRQSLDFYNDNFAGSLVSRINKLAGAFINFWNMIIFQIMFAVTVVVATIVATAFILWQYSLIIALLVTLFVIASYFGTRFMRPRQKARSKAYTQISARLSDSISNMFAIKIDSREKYEASLLKSSVDDMVQKEFQVRRGVMTMSSIYSSIIAAMRIAVLIASIWAVEQGIANTAMIYLILTYTFNVIEELKNITTTFREVYQITGDSEEILEDLAKPVSVQDTASAELRVTNAQIKFDNLAFSHEAQPGALFDNFTLEIPHGQKIGIVGASGAGKTTFTKLLMRFIDPQEGTIKIDGTDISSVSLRSLHDAIAYVPQEPLLFHRSLSENIGYSRPDATHAQIRAAAKKAHADEFIAGLSLGYNTLVGERGVKLSGGQRQRVAIARAILKDAPILILDEATSALDSESELLIQKAIENLWRHKTTIVIAHRLSTIAKLDRIIVLENGKIIEDGTHSELLKKKGTYAKLWSHQSGGFIEE